MYNLTDPAAAAAWKACLYVYECMCAYMLVYTCNISDASSGAGW